VGQYREHCDDLEMVMTFFFNPYPAKKDGISNAVFFSYGNQVKIDIP
jgi:hypothetical protein